jgi:hypothetical protein
MTSAQTNAGHPGLLDGDVVAVERSDVPRNVVGMPGCFVTNRICDKDGQPRLFQCSIVKISPTAITVNASVNAAVGDWMVANFEHLGKFEGPILQVAKNTVAMRIVATQQERDRVAAKLTWIADKSRAERRRFERFVPNEPHTTLSLSSGETLPCMVIDYSVSGAAVFADVTPAGGTALKIAKLFGLVVRHFNGGFAVNFAKIQPDRKLVETLLRDDASGHPV